MDNIGMINMSNKQMKMSFAFVFVVVAGIQPTKSKDTLSLYKTLLNDILTQIGHSSSMCLEKGSAWCSALLILLYYLTIKCQ